LLSCFIGWIGGLGKVYELGDLTFTISTIYFIVNYVIFEYRSRCLAKKYKDEMAMEPPYYHSSNRAFYSSPFAVTKWLFLGIWLDVFKYL
jgi:hypothetical protein